MLPYFRGLIYVYLEGRHGFSLGTGSSVSAQNFPLSMIPIHFYPLICCAIKLENEATERKVLQHIKLHVSLKCEV